MDKRNPFKLGLRARLFLASMTVYSLSLGVGVFFLEHSLRIQIEQYANSNVNHISTALHELHALLAIAALIATAISVVIGFISAHYVAQTVRNLFSVAGALVPVEQSHLEQSPTGDELGGLAGSLNEMAESFRDTVGTLAQERNRFSAVLDSMHEAVIAIDNNSIITLCNRAAFQLLGWTESPVGKTLIEVVRQPALYDLACRAIQDNQDDKSTQEIEVESRRATRLLAIATRLSGSSGGAVLVLRDVTELRRLELVRRDFVANVSHELRTPISTIRATAEALVDGALDDKEHGLRFALALLRNAERLSRIIADLLDLSRIEAGERVIDIQPVAIASTARRALEVIADTAHKRDITLSVDVDEELAALADEAALDHVMLNLLDNAVKYTAEGGQVEVWARTINDLTRIEVRDDGPGVAERHRERIFERFYRVDTGRSRELGGTGLGLSIVRHLMEAMGGNVGFSPNKPRGSVFWLELPRTARASQCQET